MKQDLIAFIWPALVGVLGAALILDRWVLPEAGSGNAPSTGSFREAVALATPSVVNIYTAKLVETRTDPRLNSPMQRRFRSNRGRGQRIERSLGSGVILRSDGHIVTNNHVIENADEITIYLSDDDSFSAKIVGRDEKTDIALLKFDPEGKELSVVTFGDSDTLRVGDWVMAIGNPFGLGGSVTAGIVSARGRDIGSGPYDDFIQTDASINRGNSGGPLFNLDGEVIGINTAIFSQSGGSVGIGFAISANLAEQVVTQLRDYGRTRRGWLGVFIQEVTEDIADSLGLKDVAGALVASVSEEGPAAKAGIEAGDVITSFDSKKVERSRDLPRIVAETSVDKTVPVTVIRNGKEIVIDVTLGELEVAENDGLISNRPTAGEAESFADLGFDVRPLTEELATQYGLKPEENTVVITSVAENSPASRKGLEEGLIIRRLNQTAITSVEQLNEGISAARDEDRKGILMLIEDAEGRSRFVQVSFE